ncbi:hypothetical protein BC937DRAFT_94782 [Endogone sp. FLAS-F59071]|nr:hypothetical protein BC937DRAFT_94782 [Endogone sp. FLAS-F59071]|eukprot:RUS20615.1 hypothetical protein BC937DRAFT_94782 [Endogone sp. FLAS-F59071]
MSHQHGALSEKFPSSIVYVFNVEMAGTLILEAKSHGSMRNSTNNLFVDCQRQNRYTFIVHLISILLSHRSSHLRLGHYNRELVDGLSVFMKGTPEEKLVLSFKLYDVDHDGYITQPELERVMTQLVSFLLEE